MFRKLLSLSLIALLSTSAGVPPAHASSREEKHARFTEKVKASVLKLGSGEAARMKVRLRDKTKLEGYVSGAGEEAFTVTNPKTGVATTVAYPQVKASGGTTSRRARRSPSGSASPRPSFSLSFGIQPDPGVINDRLKLEALTRDIGRAT